MDDSDAATDAPTATDLDVLSLLEVEDQPAVPAAMSPGELLRGARPTQIAITALLLARGASLHEVRACLEQDDSVAWFVRAGRELLLAPGETDDGVRLQACLRYARRREAPWRSLLRGFGLPLGMADVDSESAILAVRVGDGDDVRHVVFCLGGISRSIPGTLTDPRFGLVVALNKHCAGSELAPWRETSVPTPRRRVAPGDPPTTVRSVQADARTGYRHKLSATAAGPTPVAGLRLDTESDLLRALRVRTEDDLMYDVHGGRNLRFATPVETLDHFERLADHLVMVRERTDYKQEWDWVDHIVLVEAGAVRDAVLAEFASRVAAGAEPHTELLLPLVEGSGDGRILVNFPGELGEPHRVCPTWDHLKRWLLLPSAGRDVAAVLLRGVLRCRLQGDATSEITRCSILESIATELDLNGRHYILSEGSVFAVDDGYITRMDAAINDIPRSTFPFPTYGGGTEGDYNDRAPKRSGYRLAKLDRTSIFLPEQTAFEPCDLVTDEGTLVFAKPKGASSHFSHLCVQAVAAATLFRNERRARADLLDRVIEATADRSTSTIAEALHERLLDLEAGRPRSLTACLMILGRWNGEPTPLALPLLSRIALRRAVRELDNLGYVVELALPAADVSITATREP